MSVKTALAALLFFSEKNHTSLRTRKALEQVAQKNIKRFNLKVREVNYDTEKDTCKQYGVYVVPVTLIFLNNKIVSRYYGEITPEEFEAIFKKYSEFKLAHQKDL